MAITRFMEVMFSAVENQDEELTSQVANDIETAKNSEEGDGIETDEVTYVNLGSGKVLVIDNEKGEATIAEQSEEDPESYDLEGFESEEELQQYLHMLEDGVTPDPEIETEVTEDHLEDHDLPEAEEWEEDVPTVEERAEDVCPECGEDPCVCDDEDEEEEDDDDEEEDEEENTAKDKVFSDPELFYHLFSEVLEEEDPAVIGELKIEKVDDDTLVVTDLSTGDEAQVTLNEDDEFEVSETQKELCYSVTMTEDEMALFSEIAYGSDAYEVTMTEDEIRAFSEYLYGPDMYEVTMTEDEIALFSEVMEDEEEPEEEEDDNEGEETEEDDDTDECDDEEEYEPMYVVGLDPDNHVLVDAPVYTEEDADLLSAQLEEDGVENIQVFEDQDEAREYAIDLLGEAGVSDIEQVAEPKEHAFSDVTIYTTRYFTDVTKFMFKMFSEAEDEVTDTQDVIEEAISDGETKETDTEVITPIDDDTAVVHDKENDEYTKVTLDGGEINTEKITEEEADDLLDEAAENEELSKKFSTVNRWFADAVEDMEAAQEVPQGNVNPEEYDPETGDPMKVEPSAAPVQSVEEVEDKALAAVQSIQEAANEAVLAITEAKEAPAPGEETDLREAKFSITNPEEDTLSNFLMNL